MNPQEELNVVPSKPGLSRRVLIIGGAGGALVLLGGAAYAARDMLAARGRATPSGGGMRLKINDVGGPDGAARIKSFRLPDITPATEIPPATPDVIGLYKRRQDNSVFIGTGKINFELRMENGNDKPGMQASHDGPEVEIVFTRETAIYEDRTKWSIDDAEAGRKLQQVVAPIESLDALVDKLGKADTLMVWGGKRGDRFVAQTVLYKPPMLLGDGVPGRP